MKGICKGRAYGINFSAVFTFQIIITGHTVGFAKNKAAVCTVGRSERDRRSVFRKSIIFPILCSAKITHSLEGSESIYQFGSSIVG